MSITICVIYVTEFAMRKKKKIELNTKVCQYTTLKNTENEKKHTTKVLKKVFVLLQ